VEYCVPQFFKGRCFCWPFSDKFNADGRQIIMLGSVFNEIPGLFKQMIDDGLRGIPG